jgi:hypothetical protein
VLKEGKESGQGVAYLDDGTMVVVESAREQIGSDVEVTITSVLTTANGRLVFARSGGLDTRDLRGRSRPAHAPPPDAHPTPGDLRPGATS